MRISAGSSSPRQSTCTDSIDHPDTLSKMSVPRFRTSMKTG
jgi:hypothetical protein